jgi:dTDP-4-amino-4,6-dideoxygalactose transaminase
MTAARQGYDVRFIDVASNTFKPTPEMIIEKCCSDTVGIIWPHLFGEPTNLHSLSVYCKEKNIVLIEDCAQSLGSYVDNVHVGNQGDFGCFSFFPAKNLGAFGDAGAVITKDKEYFETLKKVKSHGYSEKYYSECLGSNFRLDTIQASILNTLFPYLEDRLLSRKSNALFYEKNLSNNLIKKPDVIEGHSWNQYTLIVDDNQRFQNYMTKNGISTMIYYPFPLHKNPVFDSGEKLLNTENLCKRVVSIPVYSGLRKDELEMITEKINEY